MIHNDSASQDAGAVSTHRLPYESSVVRVDMTTVRCIDLRLVSGEMTNRIGPTPLMALPSWYPDRVIGFATPAMDLQRHNLHMHVKKADANIDRSIFDVLPTAHHHPVLKAVLQRSSGRITMEEL